MQTWRTTPILAVFVCIQIFSATLHGDEPSPQMPYGLADAGGFTPDGKRLLVHLADTQIGLLDVQTQKLIWQVLPDDSNEVSCSLSPYGKTVLAVSAYKELDYFKDPFPRSEGGSLQLLDAATGKRRNHMQFENRAYAFSRDGALFATANDGKISVIEPATGKYYSQLKGSAVRIDFSPDAKLLAAGYGDDKKLRIYQTNGDADPVIADIDYPYIQFLPDGKRLLCWNRTDCAIIDAATGKILQKVSPKESRKDERIYPHFAADGCPLIVGLIENGRENFKLRAWDETGEIRCNLDSEGYCSAIRLSPDCKTLAVSYGVIKLLAIAGAGQDRIIDAHTNNMLFSPDSKTLLAANRAWDVASGKPLSQH